MRLKKIKGFLKKEYILRPLMVLIAIFLFFLASWSSSQFLQVILVLIGIILVIKAIIYKVEKRVTH